MSAFAPHPAAYGHGGFLGTGTVNAPLKGLLPLKAPPVRRQSDPGSNVPLKQSDGSGLYGRADTGSRCRVARGGPRCGATVGAFLLLTDTPDRAARLARDLAPVGPSLVLDVLDPGQADQTPDRATVRAVVSDISFRGPAPVAGLKRHLDRLGRERPPYVCLLHEDTPRARTQALALGATHVVPASRAQSLIGAAFPAKPDAAQVPVADAVSQAAVVLTRVFDLARQGGVAPEMVAAGAELIEGALRQADVRAWLDVVWRFDDATHQHCLLVAGLAAGFGRQIGLGRHDCRRLTEAALLHDIGKSRIPHAILNKPGRLDADEMAIMRTHPVIGYEMLRSGGYPDEMLAVVRSHHEMLDGSGYPDGLKDRQVPDLVRLVTVCDIFGALVERRPYKAPMGGDQACAILRGMEDKLDRDLVRAFGPVAAAVGS